MANQSTNVDVHTPPPDKTITAGRIKAVPRLLYGTAFKGAQTASVVTHALKAGFTGIDTAAVTNTYQEKLVGEAIRHVVGNGVRRREDIWVGVSFHFFIIETTASAKPGLSGQTCYNN